jgi:hypothetical protein
MKIRLLVFGGRKYKNKHSLWHAMYNIVDGRKMSDVTVIHGAADGADEFAHQFCQRWTPWGLVEEPYPAKWRDLNVPGAVVRYRNGIAYNVLAGLQRNQQMLDVGKPTHAIGAPGGTGTADMRRRIEAAIKRGDDIQLTLLDQ